MHPFIRRFTLPALLSSFLVSAALAETNEMIITATRFKDSFRDKPLNVSVITEEDIRNSAARTVPDLVSEKAGVVVHDFFGNNAANASIDLRGSGATGGSNTLVLLDGRRITDIDMAGVQWSAIPMLAIERIEVLRGSGAVLYGGGATNGVVNIVTRSPARIGDAAQLSVAAGSYDTYVGQLYANKFWDRLGISVVSSYYDSNGYRDNNRNRQSNVETKLSLLMDNAQLGLRLGADHQNVRLPGPRLVDNGLGINRLETDRRGTATPLDYATRDGNRAALEYSRNMAFGEIDVDLSYRNRPQTSYYDFSGFPFYTQTDMDMLAVAPRARIAHTLFGGPGNLVVGLDWQRWRYQRGISDQPSHSDQPYNRINATQYNTGFYAQDISQITDSLSLLAGARAERQSIAATDSYDPAAPGGAFGSGAPTASQTAHQHAAELGLRYQWQPAWALVGKFARSFRFANVDEIYEQSAMFSNEFQFLKAQTAITREIGVDYRQGATQLQASLFLTDMTDEIHLDPFTSGVGNTNLPPSRRRGLELEAKTQASKDLTLNAAYTYTQARFRGGEFVGGGFALSNNVIEGKTVPLVPRHKLNLGASWLMQPQTRLTLAVNHVGRQYMDNDEANDLGIMIPSYTVTDLKLSHDVGDFTLALVANNLFDRKYYNYAVKSAFTAGRYNAYPLPERNAMLTAEYRFK